MACSLTAFNDSLFKRKSPKTISAYTVFFSAEHFEFSSLNSTVAEVSLKLTLKKKLNIANYKYF